MAYKVPIKLGDFLTCAVHVRPAIESEDKDTKLSTICTGKEGAEPHAPVKVKQSMTCPEPKCGRTEASYHPFPRGQEQEDGTFKVLTAEEAADTKAPAEFRNGIALTRHPVVDVEGRTLAHGRTYLCEVGKGAEKVYGGVAWLLANDTEGAYCTQYAPSTKDATFRAIALNGLIALVELATPDMLRQRPSLEGVIPPSERDQKALLMIAETASEEFDPAKYADQSRARIAAKLAEKEAIEAGVDLETGVVPTQATPVEDSPFALALIALGKELPEVEPEAPATPKKRTRKVTVEAPPLQPVPAELPDNVKVVATKAPAKRTPRRKTA